MNYVYYVIYLYPLAKFIELSFATKVKPSVNDESSDGHVIHIMHHMSVQFISKFTALSFFHLCLLILFEVLVKSRVPHAS